MSLAVKPRPIRFGSFEVDLSAGELRKNGRRIRLQDQPFRILALLVEHPGEVVSREEIREKLWPADTFVEFEHSLNTAVNRLRGALGDSANEPRYIETVPRRGYRFVGKLQGAELESEPPPSSSVVSEHRVPFWAFAMVAAALLILGVLNAAYWFGSSRENAEPALRKFTIPSEPRTLSAAIAPNGRYIAYIALGPPQQSAEVERGLWVHDLSLRESRFLGNQAGFSIFWTSGSDHVAYSRLPSRVDKVPITGGPAVTIFEGDGGLAAAAWSADGESLFITANRLFELSGEGGNPKPLSTGDDLFWYPAILPGERKLLVTSGAGDEREVLALDLRNGRRAFVAQGERAVWSPSGHVIYEFRGGIWAAPFSPASLQRTGEPFIVQEGAAQPSIAIDGTLAFLVQKDGLQQLVWRDRRGREVGAIGQPQGRILMPVLSPDEKSVAVLGNEDLDWEIWIHEVSRGQKRRLTVEPAQTDRPAWSPEGDRVSFSSYRSGMPDIYVRPADGSGGPESLIGNGFGHGWSPDEQCFVFDRYPPEGGCDILYLRRTGEGSGYETVPFVTDEFDATGPQLSPDGRYLAYSSNETGEHEIYVQPFPEGGKKWMVSANGGQSPRWRRDGKELYYRAPPEGTTLMAVPVTTDPTFSFGTAERLFQDSGLVGRAQTFDVSSDGQRFVVVKTLEEQPRGEIHVVQNWYAEFRGREEGRP